MNISCIFFGTLFVIGGLFFAMGKLHEHIPAWKNTPDEEKKKVNIVLLCRNIGAVIMLCGVIFLLKGLVAAFTGRAFVIAMVVWLIIAGLDVRMISKSKRYQKQ